MPQTTRSQNSQKKNPPKILFKHKQWQQCYESWLRSIYEHSGSKDSANMYRNKARDFFSDPNRTPDRYTRAEIEAYVRRSVVHQGEEHPPSSETQNSRLTVLKSFYVYAAQYDVPYRKSVRPLLHTPNPTRGIKAVKAGHKRRRYLTEDELKQLFAAIPRDTLKAKRDYALFSFYFWTARRLSEIARLTWGDIFEAPLRDSSGKWYQGHMYRFSTKGHSRETFTAELPPQAWEPLKEYLIEAGVWGTMEADHPLFWRANSPYKPITRGLHRNHIEAILKDYAKLAGLDDLPDRQVCVHSFRHTRSRMQFKREHDIVEIKKLLGHSSIATTQIYLVDAEDTPDRGAAMLARELGQL